jgi:hypothetical protein
MGCVYAFYGLEGTLVQAGPEMAPEGWNGGLHVFGCAGTTPRSAIAGVVGNKGPT